jgi:hypothetical protein
MLRAEFILTVQLCKGINENVVEQVIEAYFFMGKVKMGNSASSRFISCSCFMHLLSVSQFYRNAGDFVWHTGRMKTWAL